MFFQREIYERSLILEFK